MYIKIRTHVYLFEELCAVYLFSREHLPLSGDDGPSELNGALPTTITPLLFTTVPLPIIELVVLWLILLLLLLWLLLLLLLLICGKPIAAFKPLSFGTMDEGRICCGGWLMAAAPKITDNARRLSNKSRNPINLTLTQIIYRIVGRVEYEMNSLNCKLEIKVREKFS